MGYQLTISSCILPPQQFSLNINCDAKGWGGGVKGYKYLFYTSYSYNSISRYAYRGISAHIPRRDLVIFCVLRSH